MNPFSSTPVLLVVAGLCVTACGASDASDAVLIRDFLDRSEHVRCQPITAPGARRSAIADVTTAGDTLIVALYPDDREVVLYGPDLDVRHTVPFTAEGPAAVKRPASAALAGDGFLYIADGAARTLKRLDLSGTDRGTIRLDFVPQYLRPSGHGLLITPTVLGSEPPWLLFELRADSAMPRRVPAASFPDLTVNALANRAVPAALPNGRVLVAHQFLVPRAYRVATDGQRITRLPLPLPDGVRSTLGYVPRVPVTEDQFPRITVGAVALAADPATGDVVYVTRTGRRRGETFEKALVRAGTDLRYQRSHVLDANAIHLALLAERGDALIADEEGRWFACPTP